MALAKDGLLFEVGLSLNSPIAESFVINWGAPLTYRHFVAAEFFSNNYSNLRSSEQKTSYALVSTIDAFLNMSVQAFRKRHCEPEIIDIPDRKELYGIVTSFVAKKGGGSGVNYYHLMPPTSLLEAAFSEKWPCKPDTSKTDKSL